MQIKDKKLVNILSNYI